ncbi:MAG: hypothetical protein M0027_11240 [Candidatus Dormibacteraeota bacterium]|nr:hypothetical protein [Candidatus Dormibacteraeota bacterium]
MRITKDVPPDDWAVARHEAGHFIVAMRFGHTLSHVDIIRDHNRNGVAVSSPGSVLSWSIGMAEEAAVVFLAGPAAEGVKTGSPEGSCSDSDVFAARLNLATLSNGDVRDLDRRTTIVRHWADALVTRWESDIERLAHALLAHRSLTAEEVKGIFQGLVVEVPRPPLTSDSDPEH